MPTMTTDSAESVPGDGRRRDDHEHDHDHDQSAADTTSAHFDGMSMMNAGRAGWANKMLEEYAYAAHEGADTLASGCEVSTPLSPPPVTR